MREGRYVLRLKVRSPYGVWSEPVTYPFNVLPPWWRTWWMYTVYGITAVVLISLIVWLNSRRLRAKAKELESEIKKATAEIVKQKERSEELLLNILPAEVAEELKLKGSAEAKQFDEVTVMFSDFKSFTTYSERFTPRELVDELNVCFRAFDEIMRKHKIEKIKTVGDGYIAVSGLPVVNANHAENMVQAAIEVRDFMVKRHRLLGDKTFEVRIGLHSGKVVAGIVGITKYAYDIWGDTVNTAARMEQNAEGGKINISAATYNLIKGKFNCVYRGKIPAKNKGEIDMYFVE
jgi:class 3 adenylate cyclase